MVNETDWEVLARLSIAEPAKFKILAIYVHRQQTNSLLAEAKEAVEKYMGNIGTHQSNIEKYLWSRLSNAELVTLRINSQVCKKCGKSVGENMQKYCGDGSDKDNGHIWTSPAETFEIRKPHD